jgi:predicted esterase
MWVLETALPPGGLVAAPRGAFPSAAGGYSWVGPGLEGWPKAMDFAVAVTRLGDLLAGLEQDQDGEGRPFVLMGFSQGAALAFAAAAVGRARLGGVVALSGFLPEKADALGEGTGLSGLPVFWGHGTRDERVPISRARQDLERLRAAGAEVTYCEADIGHKLGVECLLGLRAWFSSLGASPSPNVGGATRPPMGSVS